MSTFSEAIANLRQNAQLRKNEAKGYNSDEAKFATQRYQDQARLFLLAGDLGTKLIDKLATRAENDRINENLIRWHQDQLGLVSYLKSDEAEKASQNLLNNAKNHNIFSEKLSGTEAQWPELSNEVRETRQLSGKSGRIVETLALDDHAATFQAWYYNQLSTNNNMFLAMVDGVPTQLPVNSQTLTELQQYSRLQYLTKAFYDAKNVNRYSEAFLYLPKDRGGSGFGLEMIKHTNVIKSKIALEAKKNEAEYNIGISKDAFTRTKTVQSLDDYLYDLKAGYNSKDQINDWADTWKRFEGDMEGFLEQGMFTRKEIEHFANNYKVKINGQEMTLADYKPKLWKPTDKYGVEGKFITLAKEAKTKRNTAIAKNVNITVNQMTEGLIQNVTSGDIRSKQEIDLSIAEIVKVSQSADGTDAVDISALKKRIAALPKPETTPFAEKFLENYDLRKENNPTATVYDDSQFRLSLEKQLQKEGEDVKNHPLIQVRLQEELSAKAKVKDILDGIRKNEQIQKQNNEGIAVWQFKNATAERKYDMIEAYAIDLVIKNDQKVSGKLDLTEIRGQLEKFVKDNTATIEAPWENLEARLKAGGVLTDVEKKIYDLPFTKDTNGVYKNLNTLGTPLVTEEDRKEFREELLGANIIKDYDPTNPSEWIPAERTMFGSTILPLNGDDTKLDYNELIEKTGVVPQDIVQVANDLNMTTYDFIKTRMKAFGKEINPKWKKFLNHHEASMLGHAIKPRLLGKIKDGKYTNQQLPAYMSQFSPLAGASLVMTFGEVAEQFVQSIGASYEDFASSIDNDGEWISDVESQKALLGFYSGVAMSLGDQVFNDFNEGGQDQFVRAIKENVTLETLPSLLMSPEIGINAYANTGDIDFLPVLDSLQETKGQDNLNKLMQKLAKWWETEEPEEEENFTSETNDTFGDEIKTFSGTDNIDESLNPK